MHTASDFSVLVVEDDRLTQYAMKHMLTEMGATVTVAEDCATARQCIDARLFSVYFLDIGLPGDCNGTELYALIKATAPEANAFIFSAITKALFESKYPHIDPEHFIEKPILKDALAGVLEGVLLL